MKYYYRIKKRILFFRINLSYMLIGFILIFIFSLVIYHNTYINTVDKIKSWNQTVQRQAVSASGNIVSTLESNMNYLIKSDTVINLGLELKEVDRLMNFIVDQRINDVKMSNSLIRSIYLYNDKIQRVISTESTPQRAEDFYDKAALKLLEKNLKGSDRFVIRKLNMEINGAYIKEQVVTTVYRLYPGDSQDKSALIVNMDVGVFSDIVLNPEVIHDRMAMIFNKHGDVLLDFDQRSPEYEVVIQKILDGKKGSANFEIEIKGEKVLVVYEYQKQLGMYYAFLNTYKGMAGNARQQFHIFYTVIGSLFGLLLLMALGFSFLTYRPYHKLIKKIGFSEWKTGLNEWQYLNQSINDLYKKAITQRNIEKNQYLLKMCRGELDDYSLQLQNETMDSDFIYEHFRVMQIAFDKYYEIRRCEGSNGIALLQYAVKNIGEEILQELGNSFLLPVDEGIMAGIINYEEAREDELKVKLMEIRNFISQNFSVTISFYVGGEVEKSKIQDSYAEAESCYSHRFLSEEGRGVSLCHKQAENKSPLYSYPQETEKKLLKDLKSQKTAEVSADLKRFLEYIRNFSESEIQAAIVQLMGQVNNTVQPLMDSKWKPKQLEYRQICETISDLIGMEEIFHWLNGIFETMMEEVKINQSSKGVYMVDSIKSFIDGNYRQPSLSVDDIAAYVKLSNNYIRNLFKKQEGLGIGEYVQEKRLQEVCRLLKETPWPIKRICEETGFSNVNYFYAAFKKRYGVTPDVFRKTSE